MTRGIAYRKNPPPDPRDHVDEIVRLMHTNLLTIEMAVPVKRPILPTPEDAPMPVETTMNVWRFTAVRAYAGRENSGRKLVPVYEIYVDGVFLKTIPDHWITPGPVSDD